MQQAVTNAFTIDPQALFSKGKEALEKALSILADPQSKAARLTQYLEGQVYGQGKHPGHLLIQNLIGSINLERQGADTIVRFLEKALSSDIVAEAQAEKILTIQEAIAIISEENMRALPPPGPGKHRDTGIKDLTLLEAHIEDHPEIPNVQANIVDEVEYKKIPRVNSDYNKRKDVKKPRINLVPTILPS
jgi:hypothetical protein